MSWFEMAVFLAASAWMAILSLVVLVLVRQVGIMTIRIERAGPSISLGDEGPMIGTSVPIVVSDSIKPLAEAEPAYLLILSSICAPCREFAIELAKEGDRLPERVFALVPGAEEAASLVQLLPHRVQVVRDPLAAELATALAVKAAPFVLEIEASKVTGKAYVHGARDFFDLVLARPKRIQHELRTPEVSHAG